jgi:integrase
LRDKDLETAGVPIVCAKSTAELAVPDHFYRPRRSTRWYVRLIAPEAIRHLVQEPEFRRSTGQSDLRKAKPIGAALIAEKRREWQAVAASVDDHGNGYAVPTVITDAVVEKVCAARLYSWMQTDDEDRLNGLTDEGLAEIEEFCALTDKAMRSVLAQGRGSPRWAEVVDTLLEWCSTCGHDVDVGDPRFPKLVKEFAAVEKEANNRIKARNDGEHCPTPQAPPSRLPTLSSVTEAFRAHKAVKVKSKHLDTLVHAWELFVEYCGDIPLDTVTPGHIYEFLEARMSASEKPWSEARALQFGKPTLREAFGLARTRNLMTRPNPVDEMEVAPSLPAEEEAKRKHPRYPFSSRQLNALFVSSWYDPQNEAHFRGKMRDDLGARYWVPLIGLFHGNRVREALQLAPYDFSWETGVFQLSFQTELELAGLEGDEAELAAVLEKLRSLKNTATRRVVPVHPMLMQLGFAEFVEERKAAGASALLFPSSLPEAGGARPKLGRSYEQSFLRYVRDRLTFGHGFGNHSFRHQLEDRIRAAQRVGEQWPPSLAQQYMGRKRTREADKHVLLTEGSESVYGDGYPNSIVRDWVGRLDFSDLKLPPPYGTWLNAR